MIIIPVIYLTNPILGLATSSVTSSVLSYHIRKTSYWMFPIKTWQEASMTQTPSSFSSGVTILCRRDDMFSNKDGELYTYVGI